MRFRQFSLIAIIFFCVLLYKQSVLHAAENVSSQDSASADIEKKQNKLQDKIDEIQKKKEQTQKQLETSRALLSKNQVNISQTKNLLKETETNISRQQAEIASSHKRLDFNRQLLKEYLQEAYFSSYDNPLIRLAMSEGDLNDLYSDFDQTLYVKEKILQTLSQIKESQGELEQKKVDLEDKKDDHQKLLEIQKGQQSEIYSDINEAQATLSELNQKIDKLKQELTSLLGSSVSAKNIIDAADFASRVTGVRKDYLLGVLVVESNLGKYTGGCNWKQSRMSGSRLADFKEIADELNYDYAKLKVSCPPSGYKGTGGAMGVGQFMPDTWIAYKSSIAATTGHNPPDPWGLADGVTAMALKLSKVSGVTDHKRDAEAKAYCVYLAGGNWASYCDSKGVNYGGKVLYWADNYERLLN